MEDGWTLEKQKLLSGWRAQSEMVIFWNISVFSASIRPAPLLFVYDNTMFVLTS